MPMLYDLLAAVPSVLAKPDENAEVTAHVSEDSREVRPGGIFVARPSWVADGADGHDFIAAAAQRGAAVAVGQRPIDQISSPIPYVQVADSALALAWIAAALADFPARKMVMVGVTGTDGKTTTVSFLHHILSEAGISAGMITSVNAVVGGEALPTGLHVTTPTAPEIQSYLAHMARSGLTHAILEATSHGLAQRRMEACEIDVAVLTNITHEHLDFHGSWDAYRDAKKLLFEGLMQGVHKPGMPKWSVLNADDANSALFAGIPAERRLSYSAQGDLSADLQAQAVRYAVDGTYFTLAGEFGEQPVFSRMVGAHNVANALAAASAAHGLGVPLDEIAAGIASLTGVPGRLEPIDEGQDFLALVDFAHTPNSLQRLLEALRMMVGRAGRVIVVCGSAGERDPAKRAMMGGIAARLADLTVLTAEDPRSESLDAILQEMAEGCLKGGGVEGETFWRVPDRGQALYEAAQMARSGDVVVAAGKGHEQSMCFGSIEYEWDDRKALRSALLGVPLSTLPTAKSR